MDESRTRRMLKERDTPSGYSECVWQAELGGRKGARGQTNGRRDPNCPRPEPLQNLSSVWGGGAGAGGGGAERAARRAGGGDGSQRQWQDDAAQLPGRARHGGLRLG